MNISLEYISLEYILGAMLAFLGMIVYAQSRMIIWLLWDRQYQCWSQSTWELVRPALSGIVRVFDVVYFDIDNMHQHNSQHGWDNVDRALRAAFSHRRRTDILFRYKKGDELIAFVPKGDGQWFAERMQSDLRTAFPGIAISATFCVAPGIETAVEQVRQMKIAGQRRQVHVLYNR